MKRATLLLAVAVTGLLVEARPASADVTAFLGLSPTPVTRAARGWALGISMIVVGFEFEFADTVEKFEEAAPGLSTKMFNGLLITPTGSTQLYLTAGGGWYTETLGSAKESGFATNIGGGLKIKLAGPVRLRVDFRIFHLNNEALHQNPKRVYAGVAIGF